MRADKPGYIDDSVQPLLQQLGINGEDWMMLAEHFGTKYHQAVGSLDALKDFAKHTHKRYGQIPAPENNKTEDVLRELINKIKDVKLRRVILRLIRF